eukprot:10160470-Alexandrium_andersonii.AAC.1
MCKGGVRDAGRSGGCRNLAVAQHEWSGRRVPRRHLFGPRDAAPGLLRIVPGEASGLSVPQRM